MPDSNNQRNLELDRLLSKVLEIPPEERKPFLANATTHDPTLLNDVYKLLEYHEESLNFFGETLSDFLAPLIPVLEGEEPDYQFEFEKDTKIGSYRIIKLIGKGGMGQVYLAERDDGTFRKEVALKCIKKGMDSEEILRRFRYERQVLARLQHPNIATLLDGGLTDDGQPYFAMEYVDGIPITDYCDRKKLPIHERLMLFTLVCDAVQYAHQQLVVHRDLKPSNILVTENGTVKLLDFGIARILDDGNSLFTAPVTKAGMRLMTPEYAAPEQVNNDPLSTATDIYALGILLLELLTGPVSASFWKNPQKPSTRIQKILSSSIHEDNSLIQSISEKRSENPEKLIREYKGDLDTIVLTAIREEPAERYKSAEILKQDIHNYLNNLPISARKGSSGYRIKKFVHRNKAVTAFTATVLIMTLTFIAAISYQLKVTAEERNRAHIERDRAEEITNLMINLFNASDPMAPNKMDSLSVREFLDYSLSSIRTDFSAQPELKARLLNVIGSVYQNLALYDIAEPVIREGLDIRKEIFGHENLEVAESQSTLGILQWERGMYENSLELHEQALATRKKLAAGEYNLLAQNYHNLSIAHQRMGNLHASDSLALIAVNYFQNLSKGSKAEEARALENLAIIRYRLGMYDEAISIQTSVIDKIKELQPGQKNYEYADALSNLGVMFMETAQYEKAHEAFSEALEIQLNVMGERHSRIAFFLHNMGWAIKELGEFDESEDYYRRSLDLKIEHLGYYHPSTILTQSNLAVLLWATGNLDEAEPLLQDVLTARRQLFSNDHVDVIISLYNLGAIHNQKGNFGIAGIYLNEVYELAEHSLADGHVVRSFIESEYGAYLTETGQFENAEYFLTKSLSDFRQSRPDDDEMVQKTMNRLVTLYETWDKPEEAEKFRLITNR